MLSASSARLLRWLGGTCHRSRLLSISVWPSPAEECAWCLGMAEANTLSRSYYTGPLQSCHVSHNWLLWGLTGCKVIMTVCNVQQICFESQQIMKALMHLSPAVRSDYSAVRR